MYYTLLLLLWSVVQIIIIIIIIIGPGSGNFAFKNDIVSLPCLERILQ